MLQNWIWRKSKSPENCQYNTGGPQCLKSCRQNKFAICQISIIWSGIKSQYQALHDLIALKKNKTKITLKDQKLRSAAELNLSDSIHSESSIDELTTFWLLPRSLLCHWCHVKGLKRVIAFILKVLLMNSTFWLSNSFQGRVRVQKIANTTQEGPSAWRAADKTNLQFARLVLYGVELESVSGTTWPHSTEEKQDQDYAERSKAEVCCRTEFEW